MRQPHHSWSTCGRTDRGARQHLDDAARIFRNRKALRPEYCRVLFKKSRLFRAMGNAEDADLEADECSSVFREIHPGGAFEDLNDESVDELVAFWSR